MDRRDHVAGHAEGQQGDERAAGDGVVGGFRGRDAFKRAFAEKLWVLGVALGFAVGRERGRARAPWPDDADERAEEGTADQGGTVGPEIG